MTQDLFEIKLISNYQPPNIVDGPVFGAYDVILSDSINKKFKNFDKIRSIFKNLEDFLEMQLWFFEGRASDLNDN